MKIVVQSETSVELNEINILAVRDSFFEKKITARIHGLPRSLILWGPAEYDSKEARSWNNDSVFLKALEKLSAPNPSFE